ncbi:MAG: recombination mediator RecR [bacterium]|nr:recombination mediator RecR [bacterium]
MSYPTSIRLLIEQFAKFPGIGEKAAQRFVFFLLRQPAAEHLKLAKLIMNLHDSVTVCLNCYNYSERTPCAICGSASRDRSQLCVVAQSHDVAALEKTREYKGLYHVLGGNINILEGITPDKLKVRELIERIKDSNKKIAEVILAFNPDLEGESTNLYLSKLLKSYPVSVTRLARGLPRGADIDYADEVTLGDAMKSRREI